MGTQCGHAPAVAVDFFDLMWYNVVQNAMMERVTAAEDSESPVTAGNRILRRQVKFTPERCC